MYRLFYNHDVSGDILFILINPEAKVDSTIEKDGVVCLYSKDFLVGINIFNLSKTIKLKSKGAIFAPEDRLIDAVNALLEGVGLKPLIALTSSGYVIGKVLSLEEHPLDEKKLIVSLSLGDKEVSTVSSFKNLTEGALVVCALPGSILKNGQLFKAFEERNLNNDVLLCSGVDLGLEGEEAFLVEDYTPGDDFFYGGK